MTEERTAYLFVFDGYADWEPASALAELRRTFGFFVKTFALTGRNIVSMGGLTITPDLPLKKIRPETAGVIILPGGDAWLTGELEGIVGFLKNVHAAKRPIAAICAATLVLARAGLLNRHRHTSNGANFIPQHVPEYTGQDLYVRMPAVSDDNIITANGLSPFAFAAEIFRAVAPARKKEIAEYQALYARGMLED